LAGLLPTAAFGGEILLAEYTNPGVVGAYDSTSGALVNSNLLTTNSDLTGIGVSGSDVFVANEYGTVGEYTTSGGTVNSSLITESGGELGDPVVIGSNLFVANYSTGVIGEYNATSGATVNASLISGLAGPYGLATDGTNLYITDYDGDTISEYTTSGGGCERLVSLGALHSDVHRRHWLGPVCHRSWLRVRRRIHDIRRHRQFLPDL
jgi:hypothetical protein